MTTGEMVAPRPAIGNGDHALGSGIAAAVVTPRENVCVTGDGDAVTVEDERRLEKIRDGVLAGTLAPTQEAIRKLLRCRQPTAGRLNRLYGERYGNKTLNVATPPPCAGQSGATLA